MPRWQRAMPGVPAPAEPRRSPGLQVCHRIRGGGRGGVRRNLPLRICVIRHRAGEITEQPPTVRRLSLVLGKVTLGTACCIEQEGTEEWGGCAQACCLEPARGAAPPLNLRVPFRNSALPSLTLKYFFLNKTFFYTKMEERIKFCLYLRSRQSWSKEKEQNKNDILMSDSLLRSGLVPKPTK